MIFHQSEVVADHLQHYDPGRHRLVFLLAVVDLVVLLMTPRPGDDRPTQDLSCLKIEYGVKLYACTINFPCDKH